MKKISIVLIAIILLLVGTLASTIVSPILIIAEDSSEGTPGVDMAASFSVTSGLEWVYPGSSVNSRGETLHNIHLIDPEHPYNAAQEIMEYTYHYTPHIIVSINNDGAEAIFGSGIIDNIRSNDAYNGYAGSENVQGTMSRGDAVGTAMENASINVLQIPVQLLLGNIVIHIV